MILTWTDTVICLRLTWKKLYLPSFQQTAGSGRKHQPAIPQGQPRLRWMIMLGWP